MKKITPREKRIIYVLKMKASNTVASSHFEETDESRQSYKDFTEIYRRITMEDGKGYYSEEFLTIVENIKKQLIEALKDVHEKRLGEGEFNGQR